MAELVKHKLLPGMISMGLGLGLFLTFCALLNGLPL